MSETSSKTAKGPSADIQQADETMAPSTGGSKAPDYYAQAYQRLRGGNTETDVGHQPDAEVTDYYEPASPTAHTESEPPPRYTSHALPQAHQSHNSGYRGYSYHFGEEATEQYAAPPNYGSGRPAYESHPRQNFFQPMSHMGYGNGGRYYGAQVPRRPSSGRGYYDEITQPRRSSQMHVQASIISGDEDTAGAPKYATSPQFSTQSGGLSEHQSSDNQMDEDESGDFGGEQRMAQSTGTGRPLKRKSDASKNASAMSVDENFDEEEAGTVNSDESLFVPSEPSQRSASEALKPVKKAARGGKCGGKNARGPNDPRFDENGRVFKPKRKAGKGRGRPNSNAVENAPVFNSSRGKLLAEMQAKNPNASEMAPSRNYRQARWETHTAPSLVSAASVSKASLKKRGIPDTGSKNVCTKQTGASNPENIWIVNMKDVEGKTFEEIATAVNLKRIKEGKVPDMKPNAANCRYNRTAPHLYQMRGVQFIRIADRAKADGDYIFSKEEEELLWDEEMDAALVEIELEYRKAKWEIIREKVAEATDCDWLTETHVAVRFTHL